MFLESLKVTVLAVAQLALLGLVGYILFKRGILRQEGLQFLSRVVVEATLPILIFCQLVKYFSFSAYPDWWIFPLLSAAITALGFLAGFLFSVFIKKGQHRLQFLSLVTFQNSGYLPLVLVAALLPSVNLARMFVYIFLFLLGFNAVIWSFGVYLLTSVNKKKFELHSLFSPPVLATVFSLLFVWFGFKDAVPEFVFKPLKMIGDCTIPLAMFVVSGNLAQIKLGQIDKKAVSLILLAKLIVLPLMGLFLVFRFNVPCLLGMLIIMELAMPPATSLSVIITHYKNEDLLISQGILFGHLAALISVPVFLSLYLTLAGWPGCIR